MPYIRVRDDQKIHVRDIGFGRPIVLLHGFGMQSAHWLPFTLPLSGKYRFILPDLRGFGLSHTVSHNQACIMSNYAEDLADILEHLSVDKFKLGGISMGAFVALQYQKQYGIDKVDSYLHIDQGPRCINREDWGWGLFGDENEFRLQRAKRLISDLQPYIKKQIPYDQLPVNLRQQIWGDLGDFFASALSKPNHKTFAKKLCQKEALIRRILPTENWSAYIHCLQAYIEQDYDMRQTIRHLNIPLSLIVGIKSEMYPCGGQLRIADYAPQCEVIPFENSGHTPLIDQPFKFLRELKRFASAPR